MKDVEPSALSRSLISGNFVAPISAAMEPERHAGYPPYNIEKTGDDEYTIELAIAGFKPAEVDVLVQSDGLTISGRQRAPAVPRAYLHRGIAARAFVRRFDLASHVGVAGAYYDDGMLTILLRREVPATMERRSIPVAPVGARDPRLVADSPSSSETRVIGPPRHGQATGRLTGDREPAGNEI